MIFVAVGTQFPFDRLIETVDQWLADHPNESAFAQIAEGEYHPNRMQWEKFIDSQAYQDKISQASVIVSHAGMGNIITACEQQIPIIVMNRQHKLGEHRNDHQADGLKWMSKLTGVYAAPTQKKLFHWLDQYQSLERPQFAENNRRDALIDFINAKL
jgi:UDP-N-acetylglucosamine transferase subunit ALG13